jgi:glutamate synthase (NADPH/NADH) small chain
MRTNPKERNAEERIKNFNEVCFGYDEKEAVEESSRCIQCKNPLCVKGCPVNINIPGFIKAIKEGRFGDSARIMENNTNLAAVCGRVCPQESQCEGKCILGIKGEPVNIGKLERFASEYERNIIIEKPKQKNKKIAIIGSGPAGLTCAADLAKLGYKVTIFEALHKPGGVLMYGIPEFRLPRHIIDEEISNIKKLGVEIKTNVIIGKTISFEELKETFDAIFISVGAGLPYFLNVEGENLQGVYSSNEFLTRVNLMNAKEFPKYKTPIKRAKNCVVVGGGNVAMDSARAARRLGSEVTIVYRRSEKEMPARIEEIKHAKEEGIKFELLTNPVKIVGEKKVNGIECAMMELGEPDSSGRRKPITIPNSNFIIDCDQVIVAIGQGPNPLLVKKLNLKTEEGVLIVDENQQTSDPKVFAAGDITSGASTVIKAMGDAKKAAAAIDKFLNN